jgi:hypothetical protein
VSVSSASRSIQARSPRLFPPQVFSPNHSAKSYSKCQSGTFEIYRNQTSNTYAQRACVWPLLQPVGVAFVARGHSALAYVGEWAERWTARRIRHDISLVLLSVCFVVCASLCCELRPNSLEARFLGAAVILFVLLFPPTAGSHQATWVGEQRGGWKEQVVLSVSRLLVAPHSAGPHSACLPCSAAVCAVQP